MPTLPIVGNMQALPAQLATAPQAKSEIAKYAEVIDSINRFANSDVGKMLIQKVMPKDNVVGDPKPAQGDFKPMPAQITSPFYDGGDVGPASRGPPAPPQTIIKEVVREVPIQPSPTQLYDAFLTGLMQLSEYVGKEKTVEEAITWVSQNKMLIIASMSMKKSSPTTPQPQT